IYWTQKGQDDAGCGRIFRASIEIPKGQRPSRRTDVELVLADLPEPIDLELDLANRFLYWTDRGDPPRGNTVNRIAPGAFDGRDAKEGRVVPEIVFGHLMEGIGIALDVPGDRLFATDLGGSVYTSSLDGSEKRSLLQAQGNLAGIAYVGEPSAEI